MSSDGSTLQIISGYNPGEDDISLSSMQFLTTEGPKKEMFYPTNSHLAAAVSLTAGAVIVTGGLGSEKQVWMKPSTSDVTWKRRKEMLEGRIGHEAAVEHSAG